MIAVIFFAALAAVIIVLAFTWGHKAGRRSHHCDAPAAYQEGVAAEAARWRAVTGTTFEEFQAWRTGLGPDPFANLAAAGERREEPPPTEVLMAEAARQGYTGEQPLVRLPDGTLEGPDPTGPLVDWEPVPSVAEVDELAARYPGNYTVSAVCFQSAHQGCDGSECQCGCHAAEPGPPVVADITSARASGLVRSGGGVRREVADAIRRAMNPDETTALAGVILTGPPLPDRTGPDWLEHLKAEQDRDARAYMRAMDADLRSHRLQIAAGRQP